MICIIEKMNEWMSYLKTSKLSTIYVNYFNVKINLI